MSGFGLAPTLERKLPPELPTMFLIESLWKPNFCVRSKNISSVSSSDSGNRRSTDQAGYASQAPPPKSTIVGVEDSDTPMRGAASDSDEGS